MMIAMTNNISMIEKPCRDFAMVFGLDLQEA
jgi:hypothetical protein